MNGLKRFISRVSAQPKGLRRHSGHQKQIAPDDQEGYWVLSIDYSVVVTFSLVPDGADVDSTSSFDFEQNDIAGCSKRNNQLTYEGACICFAAAKRANSQELAPLAYRFNRFGWDLKITSRTAQFTLKGEVKQSFEILFGLAAENDLILHCRCCLWRSLAAATFASSLAITVSAGIQSPSASERAIAAKPRRTNSV